VTACDLEAARPLLPRNGPLVVLHLGATDPRRRWPISHFAAVGDALAEAGAKVVAIGGSGDERGLVEELQQAMQHAAIDIGADCSLHRLTGVLARAALVVGNDSGPLHLARAVGTPTVGIYWCGNLINAGPTVRTWHRQLLSWRLHCPECGANTTEHRCEHHPSFVADVPAGEAIREALDLLQQREDPCRASRPPNAYLEVMRAPSQERQEQALESPRTRA
jgi:ADP-heptose:LPS heptosyltransferase